MTGLPDKLTETPHSMRGGVQMDVLDEILSSLRLTGGVVIDGEFTGDFCVHGAVHARPFRALLPDAARL